MNNGPQLRLILINQGRPVIEGRAKQRPNGKGSRVETSVRPGRGGGLGKGFVGKGFILLMEAVSIPGRVTLTPASERSEHRCFQGGKRTKFAGWG